LEEVAWRGNINHQGLEVMVLKITYTNQESGMLHIRKRLAMGTTLKYSLLLNPRKILIEMIQVIIDNKLLNKHN
jgi:hypothetical protein